MIRIRDIDHLVLRVVDLEAMVRFYCDVLGCTVERRRESLGLVQLRAGTSLVDLVPVDGALGRAGGAAPGREGRNLDHFCFRVEPFDEAAIRAHLAAAHVAVGETGSRYGADGEGPSIYVADPEGNTVELKGPPWGRVTGARTEATTSGEDPEAEAAGDLRFPGP
ncbi:lactoylglutathione lyase [Burkholderiales bacterium]|nr:lactoylglutathione lyase [Burkholderiales bacterium]